MKIGIKLKLVSSFLLASLIPLAGMSIYANLKIEEALKLKSKMQIEAVRKTIKFSVQEYFENTKRLLLTISQSNVTKKALNDFNYGFSNFASDLNLTENDMVRLRKELSDFNAKIIEPEYQKQNGVRKAVGTQQLSLNQLALVKSYIIDNENILGEKNKLEYAKDASRYTSTHKQNHYYFKNIADKFGYYDIFLIDSKTGQIIYSVFKEIDFATSLKDGAYADSSLGDAYREALKLGEGDVYFSDYKRYFPSYDAPAGFLATPIYEDGVIRGIIAFQISTFHDLNKITLQKSTDYSSFETFIVGPDFLMRSDTLADKENRNVRSSFRYPDKGSINTDHIKQALSGIDNSTVGKDYVGRDVVASYGPLDIFGKRWAIKSIVLESEALAEVYVMRQALLIGALAAGLIIGVLAFIYSNSLSNKLNKLAKGLNEGAKVMTKTSYRITDVSTQLSEASTEQAASLQETVSSIEEISAMVQRNSDSSANSSIASESSLAAAIKGKEKVEDMIVSIKDISKGNDEIMISMQNSNEEIGQIVKVIEAISEKTKIINDIVFQTKLLSFNASVEAARAGDHGKGFAVVAEEVGNLASMSGKAATEISEMLEKSVNRVRDIVSGTRNIMDNLVKSSREKVNYGTVTANECASSLDEIIKNVSNVNSMLIEISTASVEQTTGIQEISKAMSELDQVTQQNASTSSDASSTAVELQYQASKIKNYINELVSLVQGGEEQSNKLAPAHEEHLESFKTHQNNKTTKEFVSISTDTPSSNDPRFEDF
jgi:methyl-accepting chemotaxis protein